VYCGFDYGNESYTSDGAVVAERDSEGYKPETQSLLIAKIEGLLVGGRGGTKSEPWLTVNLNRGIPQMMLLITYSLKDLIIK